jgi:shikimate kinase
VFNRIALLALDTWNGFVIGAVLGIIVGALIAEVLGVDKEPYVSGLNAAFGVGVCGAGLGFSFMMWRGIRGLREVRDRS